MQKLLRSVWYLLCMQQGGASDKYSVLFWGCNAVNGGLMGGMAREGYVAMNARNSMDYQPRHLASKKRSSEYQREWKKEGRAACLPSSQCSLNPWPISPACAMSNNQPWIPSPPKRTQRQSITLLLDHSSDTIPSNTQPKPTPDPPRTYPSDIACPITALTRSPMQRCLSHGKR